MQLEAELTTPDYKSIFQSSAFFISRTFHFYSAVSSGMSRSVVRIVRRKFQRSRPTRRFDEGNKSSRLRTSRNTIFRKIHPAGRSLNSSDYKSPFLFGLRSTRSSRFCTATSPSECCPFPPTFSSATRHCFRYDRSILFAVIRLEPCGPRDNSARPYAGLTIVSYIADSRHERKQSPRPITYGREVVRKLLKLKGRSLVETTRGVGIRAKAYALVKQPGREAVSRRTKYARN